ncbi:ABC transporter ATP-binding protein [Gaopeijia maritima]|uniref:ABC transporter ATP-binding protein n=1 Tax=Gaopeijia maritima TaxID=3119007 RepID=UPI003246F368
MSAPPAVRVEGLVKRFPRRRPWSEVLRAPFTRPRDEVLRGVSLEVGRGEFFGLLGPNGAGKTTLFKILATLVLADEGEVRVDGIDPGADPRGVKARLTPVIADERSLYWRLTGRENLLLYAALYGLAGAERREAVERLLRAVEIDGAAERMVGTYSSGMKQRLLIARALLSRPSVLLLDEPTRSLDPVGARRFRRFLRSELVDRQGCTVLLATHDADEAFELCDRLAVLDRGTVVARGTARELAARVDEHRVRIVVPDDQVDAAIRLLAAEGRAARAEEVRPEAGWTALRTTVEGGAAAGAALLARLVAGGLTVGEMAPVPVPLADIIETLTGGHRG